MTLQSVIWSALFSGCFRRIWVTRFPIPCASSIRCLKTFDTQSNSKLLFTIEKLPHLSVARPVNFLINFIRYIFISILIKRKRFVTGWITQSTSQALWMDKYKFIAMNHTLPILLWPFITDNFSFVHVKSLINIPYLQITFFVVVYFIFFNVFFLLLLLLLLKFGF